MLLNSIGRFKYLSSIHLYCGGILSCVSLIFLKLRYSGSAMISINRRVPSQIILVVMFEICDSWMVDSPRAYLGR